jgi:TolA-binding protein
VAATDLGAAPAADELQLELVLIQQARQALLAGDSSGALQALSHYHRRISKPKLEQEALFLELKAQENQGSREQARDLARRLVERFPQSPHVTAAQRILEGTAKQ